MKLKDLKKNKFEDFRGLVQSTWETPTAVVARASQKGVSFATPIISTRAELEEFAKLVDLAWREHLKFVPKITKSLSGHE